MNKPMSESKRLNLELDIFKGPLDLLLNLINQLEIDIYDIPIATVTDQYLVFLERMQEEKIDVASEYFVMAATLMRIKSEMLVPRNENQADLAEDFYEEDDDPRKPLMELLLEYKQIKEIVPEFEERQDERADHFGKEPVDVSEHRESIQLKDQGLEPIDLANIFSQVLKRHKLQTPQPTMIETDEITVVEKMEDIHGKLANSHSPQLSFSKLLTTSTKQEIVVTFLALLELIKDNQVLVKQESIYSDISISIMNKENSVKK